LGHPDGPLYFPSPPRPTLSTCTRRPHTIPSARRGRAAARRAPGKGRTTMAIGDPARPVIFTGENPGLSLFRPGTDQPIAAASYWLCSSSPHGEGSALMIWADPQGSGLGGLAPHAIYTDNAALARMLNAELNQHFGPFRDRGFADLEPQPARFSQQADGQRQHRIVCTTATA